MQSSSHDAEIVAHVFDTPATPLAPHEAGDLIAANAKEPTNDTGNGKRYLRLFGNQVMHVGEVGWHKWEGTHWAREGGDEYACVCAQNTSALIAEEVRFLGPTEAEQATIEAAAEARATLASKSDDKAESARLKQIIATGQEADERIAKRKARRLAFAVASGNSSKITGMLAQASPHNVILTDDLDADPLRFNCQNTTLVFEVENDLDCPDPDAKRLRCEIQPTPHDRRDRITKRAPVDFDLNAKCPRFDQFLRRFQPNEAVRTFLQTYMGYSITGLTGEQVMVFCYGLGANGKSTFIETIARIVGNYSQTLDFASLASDGFGRRGDQASPDLARLPGIRLVRASEPRRGVQMNESLVKSLTGGEPMLVRNLHKDFFEFRPIFKLILSGNHKPTIDGGDHGIWRRVCIVPWDISIPRHEQRAMADVLAEFWEERSGILNWILEGTKRYLTEGLVIPSEVRAATESYREEMDPVANFIRDCLHTEAGAEVQARPMYQAYCEWCEANAVRPFKETGFARLMSAKGMKRRRDRVSMYCDVRLRDDRPRSHSPLAPSLEVDEEVPI